MKDEKVIKGFKGFSKDLKCRYFQYEEGKEYETDNAKACESGFHACEYPLDVFSYYAPSNSVFHEVEQSGKLDKNNNDSKVASTKIKIGLRVDIKTIVEASIKFIFEKVKWLKKSQATGYNAGSQATGDKAGSQATGNYSMSSVNGYKSSSSIIDTEIIKSKNAVAIGIGISCIAKAPIGCWIVLAESEKDSNGNFNIISIKSVQIDGKKIKADTFYKLAKGKFVECK